MPCRICTANDEEALIEYLAERTWERSRNQELDPPWPEAGSWWHNAFRTHARTIIEVAREGHGHG